MLCIVPRFWWISIVYVTENQKEKSFKNEVELGEPSTS